MLNYLVLKGLKHLNPCLLKRLRMLHFCVLTELNKFRSGALKELIMFNYLAWKVETVTFLRLQRVKNVKFRVLKELRMSFNLVRQSDYPATKREWAVPVKG